MENNQLIQLSGKTGQAMNPLTTERLILRKFREDDDDAVHRYAGCAENTVFMLWGPNTTEETQVFIKMAIRRAEDDPLTEFNYAVVLKETDVLIGGCSLSRFAGEGEVGWILHQDYWNRGYATEAGRALLAFGFGALNLRRITARCDAENAGSFRVMEKLGMRREGLFIEGRRAHKLSEKKYGDELAYAILQREYSM